MIPTETAESPRDTQGVDSVDICCEREMWSGVQRAVMLSPGMVACAAFPLGYTCQSGAKLSASRPAPSKVCEQGALVTWNTERERVFAVLHQV